MDDEKNITSEEKHDIVKLEAQVWKFQKKLKEDNRTIKKEIET